MNRIRVFLGMLVIILLAMAPVIDAKPGFGMLFYDGEIVRTVVPPAASPKKGRDNFYVVMNGVEGQLGIAAVAPGDKDYHGGKWAFYSVTWVITPILLTSEEAVLVAEAAGDLVVERVEANDFKCPIQP